MEDSKEYQELLDGIKQIAEPMKGLYEQAYYLYKPQVDDICQRDASQKEVGWLMDWLLQYAGDDRMLGYLSKSIAHIGKNIPNPLPSTSWNIGNDMTPKALKAPNGNIC